MRTRDGMRATDDGGSIRGDARDRGLDRRGAVDRGINRGYEIYRGARGGVRGLRRERRGIRGGGRRRRDGLLCPRGGIGLVGWRAVDEFLGIVLRRFRRCELCSISRLFLG